MAQWAVFTKKEENFRKNPRSFSSCIVMQRYVLLTDIASRISKTKARNFVLIRLMQNSIRYS